MKTIEQAAKECANNKCLNNEIHKSVFKAGFIFGVKFAEQWIDVNDELPPQDELVLVKFKIVEGCDDITVLELSDENVWHFRGDEFDKYPVTHWRPINRI